MAADPPPKPSFSPYRRWGLGLHLGLLVLAVFSVMVMVNYLSRDYFLRLHVSTRAQEPLAPRTVKFLQTLTNRVNIIIYYDKEEPFYSTVVDLLNEYRVVNPRLSLQIVDYKRDPAAAQQLKAKYGFLASPNAKNLVIFDCEGRVKFVEGDALTRYTLEPVAGEQQEKEFRRKPLAFAGERAFTGSLINVTSPKPLKAYFLRGHGEHQIDNTDDKVGYSKLAYLFGENCVQVEPLELLGTNQVPMDCNLLVVAGPTKALHEEELTKIDQYLSEGGRLFALFSVQSYSNETGLETILAKWGVVVGHNVITDPERTLGSGQDVIVEKFSAHQVVSPLLGMQLHLILPRSVGKLPSRPQAADAPRVEEIAFSGPKSSVKGNSQPPQAYPLIAAVEKGAVKDVITVRGTTRMIVVGDSVFLANHMIESAANRDLAGYAANWLLDRPQLLEGIGPRPVIEHQLLMTKVQLQSTEWILLGGLPGAALVFGSLVWLRRRR